MGTLRARPFTRSLALDAMKRGILERVAAPMGYSIEEQERDLARLDALRKGDFTKLDEMSLETRTRLHSQRKYK